MQVLNACLTHALTKRHKPKQSCFNLMHVDVLQVGMQKPWPNFPTLKHRVWYCVKLYGHKDEFFVNINDLNETIMQTYS